MISFQPTTDELAFVEVAEKFAKDSLRPAMRQAEATKVIPDSIINELRALELLTMEEPVSAGGLELPLTTQVQILRALSFGDLAIMQGLPGLNDGSSFVRVLQNVGSVDDLNNQTDTLAYISGLEEQPFQTLKLVGNVLTGASVPVRSSQIATHFLIAIRDEHAEVKLLLIPNSEEIEVTGESHLGLEVAKIGKVTFNELLIDDYIIASGTSAETVIKEAELRIYILQAAKQVGLMEAACDYATEYAATRKAFGQEIAKFQAVSFRIAKMVTELQVSHNFVLEAANALDENKSDAEQKSLKAVYQAHKAVRYVTDSAVQLLGGHGFVTEFPVEKWMRDAQAQVILYGHEHDFLEKYGKCLLDFKEDVVQV